MVRHIVAVVTFEPFAVLSRVVGGFALAQRLAITILRFVGARGRVVLARRPVERLRSGAASDGSGERDEESERAWAHVGEGCIPRASYVTRRIRSSASCT